MVGKKRKRSDHPPGQNKFRKTIPQITQDGNNDFEEEQDDEQVNANNSQINLNEYAGLPLSKNARASRIPVRQQAPPSLTHQRAARGARAAGNALPRTSSTARQQTARRKQIVQRDPPLSTRQQTARGAQPVQRDQLPPRRQLAARRAKAAVNVPLDPSTSKNRQAAHRAQAAGNTPLSPSTSENRPAAHGAQAAGNTPLSTSTSTNQQAAHGAQATVRRPTTRKTKAATKDLLSRVPRSSARGKKTNDVGTNTADGDLQTPWYPQQTARESHMRTTSPQDYSSEVSSDENECLNDCVIDDYDSVEKSNEVQTQVIPLADSTNYNDNRIQNFSNTNDPINRLADILSNSIANFQIENSMSSSFSKSKIIKKLPEFSGDPLEWLHFKQALDLSTELGQCSDRENRVKLFDSLRGEAREAAKSLFASGSSASEIMHTLELRFGNSQIILEKIVSSVKELPNVDTGKINLIEFATKLKNAVAAIKSLNNIGYLHSPEFLKEILEKVPSSMLQDYARHVATGENNKAPLEKLSDFIIHEAEIALKAGILNLKTTEPRKSIFNRNNRDTRSSRTPNQKVLLATHASGIEQSESDKKDGIHCEHCGFNKHSIKECRSFAREPMRERWKIVRRLGLCYNCLQKGHNRENCTKEHVCNQCERHHHSLLHFSPKTEETKKSKVQKSKRDGSSVQALVAPSKNNVPSENASEKDKNGL